MAVRDAQTIDTIARSPEGVLTLELTEDRAYTPLSTSVLAAELRSKLNAYIYALKTSQIAERVGKEPVVVILHTVSEPPQEILDVLRAAGHVLSGESVSVDWRLVEDAPDRDRTAVLREIAVGLTQAVPDTWTHLRYTATCVGDRRQDALVAETPDGRVDLQGAPDPVRAAVEELKQLMWTPERGTWLELDFTIDRAAGRLVPGFNYNLEPSGRPLPPEVYAEELRRFPRPAESQPAWLAERVAATG
ncbi:DUF6572 domain-containing protein [Blastococcus sp. CCUG 61487]|uniref:DUF6572 domain-containing protein n=1 Tax=Blastococcus sp. CCUG 61487 TaxID=1840703 RepID=UPI0010C03F5B|nr:DUF6572 domain-containing protein [Blastococcus sp. CCUG 61487]TKJ21980.1 hypothetical protein A6V29_06720 [Blastococcus sp. CCUG 61487]